MIDKIVIFNNTKAIFHYSDGRLVTFTSDQCIREFLTWFFSKNSCKLTPNQLKLRQIASQEETCDIDLHAA